MPHTTADARTAPAARYDALWADAAPAVRRGGAVLDPWLARKDADARRGLTLLARPGADLARRLQEPLAELRAAEPEQYVQPAADLHLTVLSLFGATADHAPYMARLDDYRAATDEALRGVPAFVVDVEGVTLSRGAVLAQGFPRDGTLERVRERLREALAARGLDDGLDQRYRLVTAHLTLVRFAAPLRRPGAFVRALSAARRRVFGEMEVRGLELGVGDWYQSAERTRLVQTPALSAAPRVTTASAALRLRGGAEPLPRRCLPEGAPHGTPIHTTACARPKDLLSATAGPAVERRNQPPGDAGEVLRSAPGCIEGAG